MSPLSHCCSDLINMADLPFPNIPFLNQFLHLEKRNPVCRLISKESQRARRKVHSDFMEHADFTDPVGCILDRTRGSAHCTVCSWLDCQGGSWGESLPGRREMVTYFTLVRAEMLVATMAPDVTHLETLEHLANITSMSRLHHANERMMSLHPQPMTLAIG